MRRLTYLIFGSSRPQLLPYFWKSLHEMCHYNGPKRYIFHEDFVYPNESKKVIEFLEKEKKKGHEIIIEKHNPKVGLGLGMDSLFKKYTDDDYIFYLQEDWEFERPIDIGQIIWVMENNKHINCIFFNKYKTTPTINNTEQTQKNYSGLDMCLYHSWTFLPGIWRMGFVRKKWGVRVQKPEGYFTNLLGNHEQRKDNAWCEKNIGCYIYGKQGEYRYIRHLGNSWRMADWRLENGKPGGMIEWDIQDLPFRAPWIGKLTKVPINTSVGIKEKKFVDMLKEEPKEIQEALKPYLDLEK
jgi:hypothetical protein